MGNCNDSDTQYKILLIEDDLVDVELVRRYLGQNRNPRFVVEHTQYLQQAAKKLAQGAFDAVLLDLNLPDSCGLDSIDHVISVWETGPVIVLTGLDEECLGIDAMRHGAQDYLGKEGLSANLLSRTIRYAVERHYLVSYLEAMKKSNEEFLSEFCGTLRDPLSELLTSASDLCDNIDTLQPGQDQSMQRIIACGTRMVELIGQSCPQTATVSTTVAAV